MNSKHKYLHDNKTISNTVNQEHLIRDSKNAKNLVTLSQKDFSILMLFIIVFPLSFVGVGGGEGEGRLYRPYRQLIQHPGEAGRWLRPENNQNFNCSDILGSTAH